MDRGGANQGSMAYSANNRCNEALRIGVRKKERDSGRLGGAYPDAESESEDCIEKHLV